MPPRLKSSLLSVAIIVGLVAIGRDARAQVTYVGTFAMTNGKSTQCLTVDAPSLGNLGVLELITDPWAAVPEEEWAFFLLPNGYYAIMSLKTSHFIDYAQKFGSFEVLVQPWTASLTQMWYLYPLGNHFYAVVNVGNGKMLTDPGAANTNGNPVSLTPWTSNTNQWWYLYFLYK
jgi:hypothetical protein